MSSLQPVPGTLKPEPSNYLWGDFLTAVNGFLTVDAYRTGSNFDQFKLTQIRSALQILQTFIPQYQVGHETVYGPQDTVLEGRASRFVKPPQSIIRDIYLVKVGVGNNPLPGWLSGPGDKCSQWPFTSEVLELFQGNQPLDTDGPDFDNDADDQPPTLTWTIASISGQASVQLTSSVANGLALRQGITISGSASSFLNGAYTVTAIVSSTVVTITLPAPAPSSVTDTVATVTIIPVPTSPIRGHVGMRWACDPWPWEDRFALVTGKVAVNNNRGRYCIDPQGYTAYIYPAVYDTWLMSVWWDGLKLEFNPGDETPFDEMTAVAVAFYLKAQIALEVQERIDLFDTYMKEFHANKSLCWLRERDKTQAKG